MGSVESQDSIFGNHFMDYIATQRRRTGQVLFVVPLQLVVSFLPETKRHKGNYSHLMLYKSVQGHEG